MPELDPKPEPFQYRGKSTRLHMSDLEAMRRAILRQVRGGDDVDVQYFGDRVVVRGTATGPTLPDVNNYATLFVVLKEYDDYLLCTPYQIPLTSDLSWEPPLYDKNRGSDRIQNPVTAHVAKPYALQKTPWHNRTVSGGGKTLTFSYPNANRRNVTDSDGNTYPQELEPYWPGDVITAVQLPMGYKDPDGLPVVWLDLNSAGRSWNSPVQYQDLTVITKLCSRHDLSGQIEEPLLEYTKIKVAMDSKVEKWCDTISIGCCFGNTTPCCTTSPLCLTVSGPACFVGVKAPLTYDTAAHEWRSALIPVSNCGEAESISFVMTCSQQLGSLVYTMSAVYNYPGSQPATDAFYSETTYSGDCAVLALGFVEGDVVVHVTSSTSGCGSTQSSGCCAVMPDRLCIAASLGSPPTPFLFGNAGCALPPFGVVVVRGASGDPATWYGTYQFVNASCYNGLDASDVITVLFFLYCVPSQQTWTLAVVVTFAGQNGGAIGYDCGPGRFTCNPPRMHFHQPSSNDWTVLPGIDTFDISDAMTACAARCCPTASTTLCLSIQDATGDAVCMEGNYLLSYDPTEDAWKSTTSIPGGCVCSGGGPDDGLIRLFCAPGYDGGDPAGYVVQRGLSQNFPPDVGGTCTPLLLTFSNMPLVDCNGTATFVISDDTSDCGGGGGGGISHPCCPSDAIPETLYVTLDQALPGCECVQDTYAITWYPPNNRWEGTHTICGGSVSIDLSCGLSPGPVWSMHVGGIWTFSTSGGGTATCDPFAIDFTSVAGSGSFMCMTSPYTLHASVSDTPGGGGGGGGGVGVISTSCCPNVLLPETLTATITDDAGCACMAGVHTLTYDPGTQTWFWSGAMGGIQTTLIFGCLNNNSFAFGVFTQGGSVQGVASSGVCSPFSVDFIVSLSGSGGCCSGTISVTVS